MRSSTLGVALLGVVTFAPAIVRAQAAKSACEIDEGKPKNLALASFSLQRAFSSPNPAEKVKALRETVKSLMEEDKKNENPAGKAFVLGKALIIFASQTDLGPAPTRGDLGFVVNKDARADLLAMADSAFSIVEAAYPSCTDTDTWRSQQPWFKLVQSAFTALQAQQFDSAATLGRRSMVINHKSAYGPYILASVASHNKDGATASAMWNKAIEFAGTDTGYTEIRRRSLFDLGRYQADIAESATGDAKKAAARLAAKAFRDYLADVPTSPEAPAVRNSLVEMLAASGDSAAIPGVYADLIANPTKYDDIALVQAGIVPTRMNRSADAAKLFEAALSVNPYQRDALSNLAAMLYSSNEYDRMLPFVDRLVKLDPSNPDNWLLYAFAYQGLLKSSKDPKAKKAYTDSLVKYNDRSEKMPVKLNFTSFTRGESETSLVGAIENRGVAARPYTVHLEFLDKAGNVVAANDAMIASVAPKATSSFTVKVPKGGVAGFRYAPIEAGPDLIAGSDAPAPPTPAKKPAASAKKPSKPTR